MLKILSHFDKSLLDISAHQLYQHLSGPTLIHLSGKNEQPVFLSVLLHGNESSGWEVVKRILNKYIDTDLPRSLSIFVGNVKAARYKKRRLQSQPDFNRIWCGGDGKENKMVSTVIDEMQQRHVFASIDIHNNNGLNPHYACLNRLESSFLALARQFSRMVIYFVRPSGVQSLAFAKLCPSVTLECGQPDDEYGIQLATNFVDHVLNLDHIEAEINIENNIDLYHTAGIVKVPDEISLSFNNENADIEFIHGIERLNFEKIPANTTIASVKKKMDQPLIVLDEDGQNVFDNYFHIQDGCLLTRTNIMPAMLTDKEPVIRQDCFCYLMERYDIGMGEKTVDNNKPLWQ